MMRKGNGNNIRRCTNFVLVGISDFLGRFSFPLRQTKIVFACVPSIGGVKKPTLTLLAHHSLTTCIYLRRAAELYVVVSWDRLLHTNKRIETVIGYCSSSYGVVRCGGGQSEAWFPRSGGLGTGSGLHGHVRLLRTPKTRAWNDWTYPPCHRLWHHIPRHIWLVWTFP